MHDISQHKVSPPEPALPFPTEVLPQTLRSFVNEVAAALPCPAEFVAVPMLSLMGAAIGTSCVLEIKPGWHEAPLLYTAVVAEPGSKKSPALNHAIRPLEARQRQLHMEYTAALDAYAQGASPAAPVLAQLFTTDATVEALAVILEQNPRGIAFVQDELTSWVWGMDQYKRGRGADRQRWLSLWNSAPVIINRKNRQEPTVLHRPFVCVAGCLPPEVLGDLADERSREDGFLHRILFAFPDPMAVTWSDCALSSETQQGYAEVLERLWGLEPDTTHNARPEPVVKQFTPEGRAAFVTWLKRHYDELAADDFPEHLRGPYAKLEGYCARLALILHECGGVCNKAQQEAIDKVSVQGAISLISYFKHHANRVYGRLHTSPQEQRITKARAWLVKHSGMASLRDFVTYKVAGCKTSDEARWLFQEMTHLGHGTVTTKKPKGGGPVSYKFKLNIP